MKRVCCFFEECDERRMLACCAKKERRRASPRTQNDEEKLYNNQQQQSDTTERETQPHDDDGGASSCRCDVFEGGKKNEARKALNMRFSTRWNLPTVQSTLRFVVRWLRAVCGVILSNDSGEWEKLLLPSRKVFKKLFFSSLGNLFFGNNSVSQLWLSQTRF